MPVAEILGVLAKLEALYWIPTRWREAPSIDMQTLTDVSIDAGFVERMRACLSAPWINALQPGDLRFPAINGQNPAVCIAAQLDRLMLPGQIHDLCMRLLAADEASWAEELTDMVKHGIEHADPQPGSNEAKQRWIGIFLARHGGLRGLELQTVGDRFGITRERVRQICDAILVSLRAQPVKMPALERLLSVAARVMPLSMDEANNQLARFLGDGCGLQAAIQFAEAMNLPSPVRQASPMARTLDGYKPVSIVDTSSIKRGKAPKAKPTGKIDIAVMQSVSRQGEVNPLVENYGQVIVDECHHVGAVSFDAILKRTEAKYVLGLTATPIRRDGQQPIIFMQCGPIRYTAASPAGAPHDLEVLPRSTVHHHNPIQGRPH